MFSIPSQKRAAVVQQWLAVAIRDYPPATAQFLVQERDLFRNPVGTALREGIPLLVEELFEGMDAQKVAQALEGIVRIRAVQGFSPRRALEFVFKLKKVLRDELSVSSEIAGELDSRADEMALIAFELFVRCREQLYELRLGEAKRKEGVLERMYSRDVGG
jgi:RsbT co-antagonist protein rsbRD N-terminal domain